MGDYRIGDTLRIPFALFDDANAPAIDTDAANYAWPLSRNGVEIAAPDFAIVRPIATENDLLLTYVVASKGDYTFGRLTHVTTGYRTDLRRGLVQVLASNTDDLLNAFAVQPAVPANTAFTLGDKLYIVRGDDWSQLFIVPNADGTPKDLTDSTFIFRIGYRTAASDTALLEITGISPSDAAAGKVIVDLTDEQTAALPADAALFYDLEETTDDPLIVTAGIGPLLVVRDIGAVP